MVQTADRIIIGKKRYAVVDIVRGLAILNMIAYHTVWDLVCLFGYDWQWYHLTGAYVWQQYICWSFILVSGFCLPMSRRGLKRGLTVLLAGCLITAATALVMPNSMIIFGVLTLIGSCMLLIIPLKNLLRRCRPVVGLAVSLAFFVVTRNVNDGCLGFEGWRICSLPEGWYHNLLTAYLGFPPGGFKTADYFSLLPWLFLFVAGFYLYYICERYGLLDKMRQKSCRLFEFIGRHSLLIYLLHQPVIYGILKLILQ